VKVSIDRYHAPVQLALQQQISEPIEIAMRYGSLTPGKAFDALLKKDPAWKKLLPFPCILTTLCLLTKTAVEHARGVHQSGKYSFKLQFIKPFYDDPSYLAALAERVRPYLSGPTITYCLAIMEFRPGIFTVTIRKQSITAWR
jgi:ferrochelatase